MAKRSPPGFRGQKAAPSPAENGLPQKDPPSPTAAGRAEPSRCPEHTAVSVLGDESLTCTFMLPSALGTASTCTVIIKVIYKARPLCPEGWCR